MPGVKVIQENKEKEVTFLEDVDPTFVSLVKHGANRMPFRVVKGEKGDNQSMLTIQSILLPTGVSLEDIAALEGLGYLSEAKKDKVRKFDHWSSVDQVAASKFEDNSLRVLSTGKGWILAGKLKDGEKADDLITLGEKEVQKLALIPVAPIDAMITDMPLQQAAIALSFRDLFDKELYSLMDIIHGSLRQAAADPKKRKLAILNALDAFKSFMALSLDALGESAVKMEKRQEPTTPTEGGSEMPFEFKTQEDFTKAVGDIVNGVIKTLKDELSKVKPVEATPLTTPVVLDASKTEEQLKAVADAVTKLTGQVETIAKEQKALGEQLSADPGNGDGDPTPKIKMDTTLNPDAPKKSVFAGLLTGTK